MGDSVEEKTETSNQSGQFVIDDPLKAINILISAAERAQSRGAFSIQESKMIYDAITFFDKSKTVESINAAYEQQNTKQ